MSSLLSTYDRADVGAGATADSSILVGLGDFGQTPGPSSVLFWRVLRVLLLLRFCVIIIYCALTAV
jgi:hypothetical protein